MNSLVLENSVRTAGLFRFDDRPIELELGIKTVFDVNIYYKSYVNDDQCFNIS